ncbi:hypothetical protein FRB95_007575 [Tulasnella sp. JGI-2019a]|nr:hypothetical protein FRB93_009866 [Tulasnella sp. JGI-2019a]KAG9027613.1 hypothetical protein FRB95_007575 [Tulasnella sp. JGI-2019a]
MPVSFLLPDVHNRRLFDPTSPLDWAVSTVPTLSLLLAIRLAFEQPTSTTSKAFRYALCPLGIGATFMFCASYDFSGGDPKFNSYNYGIGLAGFTIAMKHAELVSLKRRPKRVYVRDLEKKRKDEDHSVTSSDGEDIKNNRLTPMNGNGWHSNGSVGHREEPPVSWKESFRYLCDPRGITYDFGASAFKAPEYRNVNNRTTFLLSSMWEVVFKLVMLDVFQTIIQSVPGTTIGTPGGGSIFIEGVPAPVQFVVATLLSISMGSAIYCGMDLMHHNFTIVSVGLFGGDPAEHPPLFWKPLSGTSLRQLWSKRWHPLFRQEFTALGFRIGNMVMGQLGGLLGVFMLSGLLHDVGIWGMGKGTDPWRIIGFFYLQGVGIALEGIWKKATGKSVGGPWGRLWTWSWMIATAHLVVEAWLQRGLGGDTILLPDKYRPILRLRDCIISYILTFTTK